jgi:hypothetical protein
MQGTLTIQTRTLGFADPQNPGNDPLKRTVDWASTITIPANNATAQPYTIDPGATLSLFSGSRTISADGTTQWTLTLSPLASNRYRFTNNAGTAPALRTDRALALNTQTVTVVVNSNQTATFTASGGGAFSAVVAGDTFFIPGVSTGDTAGPFNALNEGVWVVLSSTGTVLQAARPTGTAFQGFAQGPITITSNIQVQAFSAAGVQVNDGVYISAGFPTAVLTHFTVIAVNPKWFEILSNAPLPVTSIATPGANGIQFYNRAKRRIEVWADQECVVQVNGDAGLSNKVSPWQAADVTQMGSYIKDGLTFSATVVNMSVLPLNVLYISAE